MCRKMKLWRPITATIAAVRLEGRKVPGRAVQYKNGAENSDQIKTQTSNDVCKHVIGG